MWKKVLTLCVFAVMLTVGAAYASPPVDKNTSWDKSDALMLDKSSPASYKLQVGTRLWGAVGIVGKTTYAANSQFMAAANCNAMYATPTTTLFVKTTGASANEAYCLGDGQQNQRLTIVLITDGGKDFYVTPATKTGFTNVQLNDAKDSVTLKYISDTDGWVIEGNNGATVN